MAVPLRRGEAMNSPSAISSVNLHVAESSPHESLAIAVVEAIGSTLAAAAWPLALVLAIILLKSELKKLLDRISKIRHGDTEFSLDQQVLISLGEPQSEPQTPAASDATDALGETVSELSARPPIDAIVTSWVAVERALDKLPGKTFAPGRPRFPTHRRLEELQTLGILTSTLAGRIRELQMIRNRAVHDPDTPISHRTVRVYVESAAEVAEELNALAIKNP